jgi:hypothetical protein
MKPVFSNKRPASPKEKKAEPASSVAHHGALGLTERRRSTRLLPVPDAVETDNETEWRAFQSLISDNPKD